MAGEYTARCNHVDCRTILSFETEERQQKYGDDHLLIFGDGHKVYYGKIARKE